jgi:uncharacterized membrane protein
VKLSTKILITGVVLIALILVQIVSFLLGNATWFYMLLPGVELVMTGLVVGFLYRYARRDERGEIGNPTTTPTEEE